MATNVYGKVCAVFGGSRGIGRAVSETLASRGGIVAVISRDSDRAADCVDSLRRTTSCDQHLSVSCDVSCYTSVQNSLQHIQNKLGQVNVLVNVAGVNYDNLLLRTKPDEIQRTISTNLLGPMYTSQAVLKDMLRNRNGVIINIGSVIALKGNTGQCVYAASKSGLVGFTKSLAKEVASRNIRINMVAPGFIETDMTLNLRTQNTEIKHLIPLGRYGKTQEVAEAVCFLVETPYITGQVLLVDGGLTLSI
ncbi:carbonyl reductase family member 4-like [Oculina patagonica]